MRPQRRATCTHRYTSSTSADCHVPPDVAERDPDAAWVEDHLVARDQIVGSRDEHVEGQQTQHHVRPCQPAASAEPPSGTTQVSQQPRHRVASLHHVKDRQGHERRPDDQVRPPLGDQCHGRKRRGKRREEQEVHHEACPHPSPLLLRPGWRRREGLARHRPAVGPDGHDRLLHRPGGDPRGGHVPPPTSR